MTGLIQGKDQIVVWKRQTNRDWLMHVDIWNRGLPLSEYPPLGCEPEPHIIKYEQELLSASRLTIYFIDKSICL